MATQPNQRELRKMLNELLELDEGLSSWECDFIESLSKWDSDFTDAQAGKLLEVWTKHFCY
ncbi:MAG TPA: hypothetical protein HPP51_03110 [Planctomycetes bacterium]|nr:hypothetical protein [Planctomycetota bacterium]